MKGSELQRTIKELLYYDGWLVLRVNQGAAVYPDETGQKSRYVRFANWSVRGFGFDKDDGISDLLAFKDGVLLAVEIKGDGDSLRPSQIDFLEAAAAAGAVPVIAECVEDVGEWLSDRTVMQ